MGSSRALTLRRSSDFLKIRTQGKRITATQWLIVGYLPTQSEILRWGCTISGKVGNAVIRNRLKRWCREYFRHASTEGSSADINLVFRPSANAAFYKEIDKTELFHALDRGYSKLQKALCDAS